MTENQEEIDQLREEIEELESRKEDIENNESSCTDEYDDIIDEMGEVNICGLSYCASTVLKAVDEIAYNCGYNDYFDEELSNLKSDIDDKNTEIADLEKEEVD